MDKITPKKKWPTKDTLVTAMFLVLFIEVVWVFHYRIVNGVYKTQQDIWTDLGFMTFYGAMAIFFAYREHKIFIGHWKAR